MNWKRGLNRIYLVLALCWVIYVLVLSPVLSHDRAIRDFYRQHMICTESLWANSPTYKEENKRCDDILAGELAVFGNDPWDEARAAPLIPLFRAFLLPLVVYVVGWAIIWFVYRGFRKSTPPLN
jgi:hypothetical protein